MVRRETTLVGVEDQDWSRPGVDGDNRRGRYRYGYWYRMDLSSGRVQWESQNGPIGDNNWRLQIIHKLGVTFPAQIPNIGDVKKSPRRLILY